MAGKEFGAAWLENILSTLNVNEGLSPLVFRDIPAAKAAQEAFDKYQQKYGILTWLVDYSLQHAHSAVASVTLGEIDPPDLADWKYFIKLYRATGRALVDPWIEFCGDGSHNTRTKGEVNTSPLVLISRPIFRT